MFERFKNDSMMKKLHEFREKEYLAIKNLTFEERKKRIETRLKQNLREIGYNFTSQTNGRGRIVTVSEADFELKN